MKTKKLKSFRSAPRHAIEPLQISSLSQLENLTQLSSGGVVLQASVTGFLVSIKRDQLLTKELRNNLNMDSLIGKTVIIHLDQMNLEISGKVARTKFMGKGNGFEIGIDYSADAPEYWRECLMDLLPMPGELD